MTFWITFGMYAILMLFVWGFFFVAKLHIHKFRHYSEHVIPATKFINLLLLVITIAGFIVIYRMDTHTTVTKTVQEQSSEEVY